MIRSPADIVSLLQKMPVPGHTRVGFMSASFRALPWGRGTIEQAVMLWIIAACLQLAECRGQVFGGCDCAGPVPPKPAAQLDAERQQIVGELDGMHDSRESLIADHARKNARQLEVSVLMRLPAARPHSRRAWLPHQSLHAVNLRVLQFATVSKTPMG
jgi:hypothetical protein